MTPPELAGLTEVKRIAGLADEHLNSTRLTVMDGTLALRLVRDLALAVRSLLQEQAPQ